MRARFPAGDEPRLRTATDPFRGQALGFCHQFILHGTMLPGRIWSAYLLHVLKKGSPEVPHGSD
jgi:hypothetical protein